jgi:hypothetical protein
LFYSSKFKLVNELAPTKNTEETHFLRLYWDQFNDFDSFSSFVTKSGQISIVYFALNSFEIQEKPNVQYFIRSKKDKFPDIQPHFKLLILPPLSRPLQLLTQKSYWDDLLKSYFLHIHPIMPLFSIHSFNPITAAKTLLSSIYYCGFQSMEYKPPELVSYFNEYSDINIKIAIRSLSLDSVQALTIYSILFVHNGDYSLSRYCQSHAIRMSYALGLHLNLKTLSPILQYNRLMLFSSITILNTTTYAISHFNLNQLAGFEDFNTKILKPVYQTPNSNCAFYFDKEDENIVYGFCADAFTRALYMSNRLLWMVSKCSENSIQAEFDTMFDNVAQNFSEIIQAHDLLSEEYPYLKDKIQDHKHQLSLSFHTFNLEAYRILRRKVSSLSPNQVSKVINECCTLFDLVVERKKLFKFTNTFPYTAGLNLSTIYPISNSLQQSIIKQKLGEILDFLSSCTIADKLSYLIIKNEYESIIKSEDKLKLIITTIK